MNVESLASGLVLVALGAFFGYSGRALPTTLAGNMGPGYFPLALSGVLGLLGVVLAIGSLRGGREQPSAVRPAAVPWRALILLSAAFLWFAITVRPLGLGPALAAALMMACLASPRSRWQSSLLLSLGMTLFAWAIFIKGLKLPVRLLGPWFFG